MLYKTFIVYLYYVTLLRGYPVKYLVIFRHVLIHKYDIAYDMT